MQRDLRRKLVFIRYRGQLRALVVASGSSIAAFANFAPAPLGFRFCKSKLVRDRRFPPCLHEAYKSPLNHQRVLHHDFQFRYADHQGKPWSHGNSACKNTSPDLRAQVRGVQAGMVRNIQFSNFQVNCILQKTSTASTSNKHRNLLQFSR